MVIELFAGAGGMSHGAHLAGLESHGIEWNADAVATRLANGLATSHGDVRDYGPADFPTATRLAGGPPCQTFSVAGNGSGRRQLDEVLSAIESMAAGETPDRETFTDDRTSLVLEPLRWALEAHRAGRPYEAIVLEQVPAVLPVWDAYATVLRGLGYSVATGVLKAEQYGLPQTRRRAVLVARLDGVATLPEPAHRAYRKGVAQNEGDACLKPWVASGDVIRPGTEYTIVSNFGTGGDPKNRGTRTHAEPAPTVVGRMFSLADKSQPKLTWSECGMFQGFPTDWTWAGKQIRQQIGNACPPPLAEVLFRSATQ